jgi:alkylhydroperoxidase family enzyme
VNEARLPPLPPDRWNDEIRTALAGAFPEDIVEAWTHGQSHVPNVLGTLVHHPALAGRWLAYNNVLLWSPSLAHRARELMILRVAHRTGSEYEWTQHVALAGRFGITDDDVNAIANDDTAPSWTPLERALVAATDQLLDDARIDDATWKQLAEHLDERQLVEAVFVVGTYTTLAMAFNSFGVQID